MKVLCLITLLLLAVGSYAQSVIQAEYFWDTDPGQGNGAALFAADGSLNEAVEALFESNLNVPTIGLHTFNIRVKGENNTWSNTFSYTINVTNNNQISRSIDILQAEYFWDTDPGQGNGTAIFAADGNLDEAVEALFENNVSIPTTGLHTFNIRIKGEDNTWSNVFSYAINVADHNVTTRDVKLTEAEYYWDTDPGQGNGYPILAADGNLNEAIEELFSNNLSYPMNSGNHVFYLRVKGQDGSWSSSFGHFVSLTQTNSFSTIDTLVCGSSYIVPSGDESYTVSGTYYDTLINAGGYDSLITINLLFGSPSSGTDIITACNSHTWIDGVTYTSNNNTATYTLTNASGCDSTVTLDLTINQSTSGLEMVTVCDSYTWTANNVTYTNSGVYTALLTNAAGCDSLITLDLTIKASSTGTDVISACSSYTWINGVTYTASNNTATYVLTNSVGCDSVVTLNLTIGQPNSGVDIITACGSYTWIDGVTYTSSNGNATYTLSNVSGCDSIVTLNLVIYQPTSGSEAITACGSYTWSANGSTYTTSGTYMANLTNSVGCDSIATLNLTINNVDVSVTNNDPALIANLGSAQYQWINCDNNDQPIPGETGQTFTAMQNGTYAVIITENSCIDTSACYMVQTTSVIELGEGINVSAYPIPSNGSVNLLFDREVEGFEIIVTDSQGRKVSVSQFEKVTQTTIELGEASGVYFLTLITKTGQKTIRLIKN